MTTRAAVRDAWRSGRAWERALCVLLAATAVYLAARGVAKGLRPIGSDFTIYLDAWRAALAGRDPYAVAGFLYPPSFALGPLTPLGLLPEAAALVAWQSLSLACLVAVLWATWTLLARALGRLPAWALWLPGLCVLRLVDSNLAYGQANAVVFACVAGALVADARGRPWLAGAFVGLGAALKVVPVALLLWFGLRRSWRAAAATLLAALALGLAVPAVALGPGRSLELTERFLDRQVRPYAVGGEALLAEREFLAGQSVLAATYRLLVETPATSRGDAGPTANVADLDPGLVHGVVRAVSLALVAAFVLVVLRAGPAAGSLGGLAAVSALCVLAVLLTPLAHKAHFLWALPGYAAAWAGVLEARALPGRWLRLALLGASVVLVGAAPALVGEGAALAVALASGICLGMLALYANLLLLVRATAR